MASPGDLRLNPATGQWEQYIVRTAPRVGVVGEWRVITDAALLDQLAQVPEIDGIRGKGDATEFHQRGQPPDIWTLAGESSQASGQTTQQPKDRQKATSLLWPNDRPLPMSRQWVRQEPVVDKDGNITKYNDVWELQVDWDKIWTNYEELNKQAQTEQDKQAQVQFHEQNVTADNARLDQQFAYKQQQDALNRQPTTLEGLMAQAVISGNLEAAYQVRDFIQAPTPFQYLQLALNYAAHPAALEMLYNFFTGSQRNPFQGATQGQGQGLIQSNNPFQPGTYAARQFDALPPATQQQYQLRQQYLQLSGGVLPGQQAAQPQGFATTPFGQTPQDAFQGAFTNQPEGMPPRIPVIPPSRSEGMALEMNGINPATNQPLGPLSATSQSGTSFALPPGSAFHDTTDAGLEAILSAPETTSEDKADAAAEQQRRAASGAGQSFSSFLSGGPDIFGALTPEEAANRAKGNPYQGKILATGPTGQWDTWVPDPDYVGINPLNGQTIRRSQSSGGNPFGGGFQDFLALVRRIKGLPTSMTATPQTNPFARTLTRA